jgi:hypothetical protein
MCVDQANDETRGHGFDEDVRQSGQRLWLAATGHSKGQGEHKQTSRSHRKEILKENLGAWLTKLEAELTNPMNDCRNPVQGYCHICRQFLKGIEIFGLRRARGKALLGQIHHCSASVSSNNGKCERTRTLVLCWGLFHVCCSPREQWRSK